MVLASVLLAVVSVLVLSPVLVALKYRDKCRGYERDLCLLRSRLDLFDVLQDREFEAMDEEMEEVRKVKLYRIRDIRINLVSEVDRMIKRSLGMDDHCDFSKVEYDISLLGSKNRRKG